MLTICRWHVNGPLMDRRTCWIKCGFAKWFEMFLRLVFDVESIFYIPKHPRLLYHALLGMLVVIDMKSNSWVWLGTDILELNQAFSFKKNVYILIVYSHSNTGRMWNLSKIRVWCYRHAYESLQSRRISPAGIWGPCSLSGNRGWISWWNFIS